MGHFYVRKKSFNFFREVSEGQQDLAGRRATILLNDSGAAWSYHTIIVSQTAFLVSGAQRDGCNDARTDSL